MKTIWITITNIGANLPEHQQLKRSLSVFNRLIITLWAIMVFLNLIGELLFGGHSALMKVSSITVLTGISLLMNANGMFRLSRVLYLLLLNFSYFVPYLFFGANPIFPYLSYNVNLAISIQAALLMVLFDDKKSRDASLIIPTLMIIYLLDVPILQSLFQIGPVSWTSYFALKAGFLVLMILQYFSSYLLSEVQRGFNKLNLENEIRYNQIRQELNQLLNETDKSEE